jgi:undecaprenyl-diphosphatase
VTLWQAVLLGLVQGVTEFFPISSDGHLTLFQAALRIQDASLALDVALHVGTLAAVLFFFRKDFAAMIRALASSQDTPDRALERRRALCIVVATVFTGAVGLSLKESVEASVTSFGAAGVGFLLTALFLSAGDWAGRRGTRRPLWEAPWWHLAVLGLAQGAAVWPGLSRSGSTIAVALILGWRWEDAGRFSFLMSVPAVAGATLLTARDMAGLDPVLVSAGILASFAAGWVSLAGLMRFLRARRLWPFAVYCAAAGIWALSR